MTRTLGGAAQALDGVLRNLSAAVQLIFFRPVGLSAFVVHADQILALLVVIVAVSIGADFVATGSGAIFNVYGLVSDAYSIALLLLAFYLVSRILGATNGFVAFAVLVLSTAPWLTVINELVGAALEYSEGGALPYGVVSYAMVGWYLIIWARAAGLVFPSRPHHRKVAIVVPLFAALLPVWMLPSQGYWYPGYSGETRRPIDVEATYYRQPALLQQALGDVAAGRPGVVDLYHIGFGSYAGQSVFRDEVRHVRRLLEARFDTAGRSVTLINHPDTVADTPLASATNLERVLYGVANRMDLDEDVLLLYLTSHGSPRANLAVDFGPLRLNQLSAQRLRGMLDAAGIRWRVVVVSACYSGSFTDALADDQTLVITAAAHDRQSFGCSNANEFTYFGEAYFKEALAQTVSFTEGFALARNIVSRREKAEQLEPSQPTMRAGAAIERHLERLESRLSR